MSANNWRISVTLLWLLMSGLSVGCIPAGQSAPTEAAQVATQPIIDPTAAPLPTGVLPTATTTPGGTATSNATTPAAEPVEATEVATPETTNSPVNTVEGTPLYIGYIQMLDELAGWAAGSAQVWQWTHVRQWDRVLQTTDGGRTWQDRTPPGIPPTDDGVQATPAGFFRSAEVGWVSYPSITPQPYPANLVVWMTNDGGQSWTASEPLDFSGIPMDFFRPGDIRFLNEQFGWLIVHLGAGMNHDYVAIFTTADGGQTWQRVTDPQNNPDIQSCVKSGFVFTTPTDGWLAGNCPGLMPTLHFYRTADGGMTWTPMTLPATEGMPAAAETLGDACGIPQLGTIGGTTLALQLRCMAFEENVSQAWLYTSSDNGQSWQFAPLPVSSAELEFISAGEGWLLGAEDPSAAEQAIYHTADGGQSWNLLTTTDQSGHIEFNNIRNGWIASDSVILHSADGGHTWQELEPVLDSDS